MNTFSPPRPPGFNTATSTLELHFQGAEAVLYRTHFLADSRHELSPSDQDSHSFELPNVPAALKYRPPKLYRHPALDAKLTRHRILSEARILVKLFRDGLRVPAVYALDWEEGWLLMEWIDGTTIRAVLDEHLAEWLAQGGQQNGALWNLMGRLGALTGQMHKVGVVHGDLTTSNIMMRRPKDVAKKHICPQEGALCKQDSSLEGDLFLIDFGLAAQTLQEEDRAVDLYVLERAFGSTHPKTEHLFQELLRSYGNSYSSARVVLKRFQEVRMRGRKKIMIG